MKATNNPSDWKRSGTLLEIAVLVTALVFGFAGCPNDTAKNGDPDTVINIAAIEGVTVPAAGETLVTKITETEQYTGSVRWEYPNGYQHDDDVFYEGHTYVAIITLTAQKGFTLEGVAADFFTVAGTSIPASNAANKGVITAMFPATLINASMVFGDTEISRTYGDAPFHNPLKYRSISTGDTTYSSNNESVATVDDDGLVTIHKAGTAVITASTAADDVYTAASDSYTLKVNPKPLTVTGITVKGKVYDGNTDVEISGTPVLSGMINGDVVTIDISTAAFADKNSSGIKPVTGFTLGGEHASNYTVPLQSVTGTIMRKEVTITGITVADKVYDGTTTATPSGGTINGLIDGDTVSIVHSSAYFGGNGDVGNNIYVSFSYNYSITGTDAGNYNLSGQPANTWANITAKPVTITGMTAADKVYDRTLAATPSGGTINGLISGDTVTIVNGTAAFANATAGNNKTVTFSGFTLGGAKGGNYSLSAQPANATANITAKPVTITGLTAANKPYDRTTAATVTGTPSIAGLISGDTVTVSDGTAAFNDKTAGNNKTVTFSGYSLAGADAGNYGLSQPAAVTANITAIPVTITGLTAANKVYDRTTAATPSGGTINGVIGGDTVIIQGTGTFASVTVDNNKTVTFNNLTLGGADGGNYSISAQPANSTAHITAKPVTITGLTAANKVYDRTTTATPTGGTIDGLISGDTVIFQGTGAFASATAGNNKTVTFSGFTFGGADGGNYSLSAQPANATANITAKPVTITGITAANKEYDRTTTATVTGTAAIIGLIGDDTVTTVNGTAAFNDITVGVGKTVTFSGFTLDGADAGNYSPSQPANVTANITVPTIEVVRLYGGTFRMGSMEDEPDRSPYETPHQVTLTRGFYMGKYEVTQIQYEAVTGSNPSHFTTPVSPETSTALRPVEMVSWYDALVFCNKLSMIEGYSPAYSISGSIDPDDWGDVPLYNHSPVWDAVQIVEGSTGYRLPTEAQWEYACRAGTTTPFNTGLNITTNAANYDGNYPYNNNPKGEYRERTTPVGSLSLNIFNLYDMHGNVWEWCWDGSERYSPSGDAVTDPEGPISGYYNRVMRGGSWNLPAQYLRSAQRGSYDPYYRSNTDGFRLVRPAE